MKIEYSVITGFLGKLQDRFTDYQTKRTLEEKLELASKIKGLQGIELIYPSDFSDFDRLKSLIEKYRLGVSAINVNLKAESLSLLVSKGKLFYLHINDNCRNWDWDLIPGFVNFWDYLELLFYLREYDYQGWIAMDVSPKNLDPVEVFATSIEFMRNVEHILKNIDSSRIFQLMKERNTPKIFSYLQDRALNLS